MARGLDHDAERSKPSTTTAPAAESAAAESAAASTAATSTAATSATAATSTAAATSTTASATTAAVVTTIAAPTVSPATRAAACRGAGRSNVACKGCTNTREGGVDAAGETLQGGHGAKGNQRQSQGVLHHVLCMLVGKHALHK